MTQFASPTASSRALRLVKVAHTAVWAFFVACLVAIPIASLLGRHSVAVWLAAAVLVEVLVLALNNMSCPLTAVAGRYTSNRSANFDIYLPEWLAEHNKGVFGTLYVAGVVFALVRWQGAPTWQVRSCRKRAKAPRYPPTRA